MMTDQEYQERVEELGNEIAFNLEQNEYFEHLILETHLEEELDTYYSQEDEIDYNDLEYEVRQALEFDGYTILDETEYAIEIGERVADEIYHSSERFRTSYPIIESEIDYYNYPEEVDREDIFDEAVEGLINLGYTITEEDTIIAFPYHCTPNEIITPYEEDKTKNIKGLELEISDDNYTIDQELEELKNDHIIGTPNNWSDPFHEIPKIALEEDSSVRYELIFKAQTNEQLMEEIEKIQNLNAIVDNHTGTSAHIHMNRQYLEDELEINEIDIVKAAEFLNHPLFLMSGRKKETAHQWARSQLPCPIDANLAVKAKQVDRLNKVTYAKYNFVNCSPEDTIELRIFSNKCNFNKYVINMYLETVDFIIELAEYMKDKTYTKELKNIIPLCKNHFEKFGYTLDFYNTKEKIMNEFKEPKTLIKTAIKNEWITIDDQIASFLNYAQVEPTSYDTIRRFIRLVRTLNREHDCNYDFNINPETIDVQKLGTKIRIDIEETYNAKMEAI